MGNPDPTFLGFRYLFCGIIAGIFDLLVLKPLSEPSRRHTKPYLELISEPNPHHLAKMRCREGTSRGSAVAQSPSTPTHFGSTLRQGTEIMENLASNFIGQDSCSKRATEDPPQFRSPLAKMHCLNILPEQSNSRINAFRRQYAILHGSRTTRRPPGVLNYRSAPYTGCGKPILDDYRLVLQAHRPLQHFV